MNVQLSSVLAFVRSWSEDDAYDRFGMLGGREWLISELRGNGKRGAIVATIGKRVVGLLDHIEYCGAEHIGVFVDARFRNLHVGTRLVRELLRARAPDRTVAAECRASNSAAVGLLRCCGFDRVSADRGDIVWRHR